MLENKPLLVGLTIGLVVIVAGGIFFFGSDAPAPEEEPRVVSLPIPEPEPVPPPPEPEPEPEPVPEPEPEPVLEEPAFVLPLLEGSDGLIRDGLMSLSRHEGMNQWVAVNDLIRKFVGFTNGVSEGRVVRDPVRVLAPQGAFPVIRVTERVSLLDPKGYARYDRFVTIFESLDSDGVAEFYVLVLPLLNQAYNELGLPKGSITETLFKAIGRLLEVPTITRDIRLVQPVVMYEFEDSGLERLSPAQKQMLRMGPDNTRRLQAKLSEISRALRAALERD
jgi:hypothetical protein